MIGDLIKFVGITVAFLVLAINAHTILVAYEPPEWVRAEGIDFLIGVFCGYVVRPYILRLAL